MSKLKHTSGPWWVGEWTGNKKYPDMLAVFNSKIKPGNKNVSCICAITELDNQNETDIANALLIATAPEMMEALIFVYRYLEKRPYHDVGAIAKGMKVKEVIEKATRLSIEEVLNNA